jgi:nickel-type superoxide dismutase maturation protease
MASADGPGSYPEALLPFGFVVVSGPSMVPTLRHGDRVLVRYRARARPGDVVVATRPDQPSLVIVKRAVRREAGGWWLEGDNPFGSDDSRAFGLVADAAILGRVVGRLGRPWRLPRRPSG